MRHERNSDLLESISFDNENELKFHFQCKNYQIKKLSDKYGLCDNPKRNEYDKVVGAYDFCCIDFKEQEK